MARHGAGGGHRVRPGRAGLPRAARRRGRRARARRGGDRQRASGRRRSGCRPSRRAGARRRRTRCSPTPGRSTCVVVAAPQRRARAAGAAPASRPARRSWSTSRWRCPPAEAHGLVDAARARGRRADRVPEPALGQRPAHAAAAASTTARSGECTAYESRFERWRPQPQRRLLARGAAVRPTAAACCWTSAAISSTRRCTCSARRRASTRRSTSRRRRSPTTTCSSRSATQRGAVPPVGRRPRRCTRAAAARARQRRGVRGRAARRPGGRAARGGSAAGGRTAGSPSRRGDGWRRGDEVTTVPSEPGRWDLYYPAVARAVRGEGTVPVDPVDAVLALRTIEAARESARSASVLDLSP